MANLAIPQMTLAVVSATMRFAAYDPSNTLSDISVTASDVANLGAIEAGANMVGANGSIFVPVTLVGASYTSSTNSATLTITGAGSTTFSLVAAIVGTPPLNW